MRAAAAPANEPSRLASLRALRILDSLPEQEYDDIVHLAAAICGAPIALISLIDADRQWIKARVGLDVVETPRDLAFCAHAILREEVMEVPDTERDERFAGHPAVTDGPKVRFYAGAPLRSPDGFAIGTVCVVDRAPRRLDDHQRASLEVLSRQVTRLLALRTRTAQLEEATARFRAAFDRNAVGLTVIGLDGRFLEVNRAFASMLGYAEGELVGVHVRDVTHPDDLAGTDARLREGADVTVQVAKRFLRKDGSAIWTEAVGRKVNDDQGRPLYWITQVQNVTARNEGERRLRLQYEMTRILAETPVLEEAGGYARFEVADTGPGIAPELRARLFQKFQQLDASDTRSKGGTGLGLAISKALVEQLGGRIGVDSAPGEGSTFWLELGRQTVRPPAPTSSVVPATVLIVEDDDALRSMLGVILEGALGVRVAHAADGAVAVQLARAKTPDVIVLDVGVPRPNGFEVISILREEGLGRVPLIVFSGREVSAADRGRLTLEETRFLTKGRVSEEAMVAMVRDLLAERVKAS